MLNELFGLFEDLTDQHGCDKVDIIEGAWATCTAPQNTTHVSLSLCLCCNVSPRVP